MQEDGRVKPARYESGLSSMTERKYNAMKLECRGLLKGLKKLRFWLFGRFFHVETDEQTPVWLLNQPPNDLPNALLTRWLLYIGLFDFEVKRVRGEKNGEPDRMRYRAVGKLRKMRKKTRMRSMNTLRMKRKAMQRCWEDNEDGLDESREGARGSLDEETIPGKRVVQRHGMEDGQQGLENVPENKRGTGGGRNGKTGGRNEIGCPTCHGA
jgi:hypothetical protein